MEFQNAEVREPAPPGPWCSPTQCDCGGTIYDYDRYNSGVTFAEAEEELRQRNESAGLEYGGYRSRGPILYMMRVLKLERFYEDHQNCDADNTPEEWAAYYETYDAPGGQEYLAWYSDWQAGETDLDFEDWATSDGDSLEWDDENPLF